MASASKENKENDIFLIFGTGSSLVEIWDSLWYLDVPKDIIQEEARKVIAM